MAADLDAHPCPSEVSNIQFEGQGGLNSPSREDLPKVGGDCNSIVHDIEERIGGEVKDDGDGSYVFVEGADTGSDGPIDTERLVDPTEAAEGGAIVKKELNANLMDEERQVRIDELKMDQKGNSESQTDQTCVSSFEHDLPSECSQCQINANGVEKSDEVEEKNNIESAAMNEGDQESLVMHEGDYKLQLPQTANEDKIEEENKCEAAVAIEEKYESELQVTESVESMVHQLSNEEAKVKAQDHHQSNVPNAVESEQHQLGNCEEKMEEINNVKSNEEAEKIQFDDEEEKVEGQCKLDSSPDVGADQDSEIVALEAVENELHQLDNGEKENGKITAEIPVEQLEKENKLNMDGAAFSVDGIQLESDATDCTDGSGKGVATFPALNSGEFHESVATSHTSENESENENVNESDEDCKIFAHPVPTGEEIFSEVEVTLNSGEDVQLQSDATDDNDESGKSVPTFTVLNSGEVDESIATSHASENESGNKNVNESVEDSKNFAHPVPAVEEIVSEVEGTLDSEDVHESIPTSHPRENESENEIVNESVEDSINFAHPAVELKSEIVFGDICTKIGGGLHASPAEFPVLKPVFGSFTVERDDSMFSCSVDSEKSESKIENGPIENDHNEPILPVDDAESESQAMNGSIENCDNLPANPVDDPQMNCEAGDISAASDNDMHVAGDVNEGSLLSDISVSNGENMPDCVSNAIDIEEEGDPSVSRDSDGKQIFEEVEGIEGIESNGNPPSPPENSTIDPIEGHKVDEEVERSFFLIRIPRFVDDKIRNEIGLAQLQVDEKTRSRDAIRSTIQLKRATCNEYRDKFEAIRLEERAARDVFNAKRQEMDFVQSMINRMKNATSIDEIDERIQSMEHRIEHETVPLKEEKQIIREIKQLKHIREQYCASLGRQAEVQPTSEQRDRVEERFKLLKQELDSARNDVLQAEGATRVAKKSYFDENEKLKELQAQFRAADDLRQEAYTHLQNLKKQLYDKNKYFRMYKEDASKAKDYAFKRDREALEQLCANQVETVMELWNKNDEFRDEYVRCNINSTFRRFKTLDGRRLSPDEEPPLLPSAVYEKVDNAVVAPDKIISTSLFSISDQGTSVPPLGPEVVDVNSVVNMERKSPKVDIKSVVNLEQRTPTKSKKALKPTALENSFATVSGWEGTDEKAEEVNKETLEEEELARKAEELQKEEAAAKLKEQRRLEEKAKAKEAEERKKRNAEKAQARAELRAQKEAELKEKEREKRARKKERKRSATSEVINSAMEGESTSGAQITQPETIHESEVNENPTTMAKRPQKPSQLVKQTKTRALPPLRNRGKRRMQPWMWVLLVVLAVLALFLVGNSGYSFKFGTRSFGF